MNSTLELFEADGSPEWITARREIKRDANGQIVGLRGTAQDITERKQAEDQIRQLNTDLELRVEARYRELREAQDQLIRQEKLAVLGQLAGGWVMNYAIH